MHASIIDGQILTTGSLPTTARRTDTGAWVLNLTDAPVELREACGWYEVIDVERPPDTDMTTFDPGRWNLSTEHRRSCGPRFRNQNRHRNLTRWRTCRRRSPPSRRSSTNCSQHSEVAAMGDPRIDRIAARQAAQTAATHLTVAPLMADTAKMSDEQVGKLHGSVRRVRSRRPRLQRRGCRQLRRCPVPVCRRTSRRRTGRPTRSSPVDAGSGDEGRCPDPFVQPTGAAGAYSKGDRVTFEGAVWESVIDANVWSPTAYPAGWKALAQAAGLA